MAALTIFISTGTLGLLCTWIARSVSWRVGAVARPNPLVAQHTSAVACFGGVGIAAAAGLAMAVLYVPGWTLPFDAAVGIALPAVLYLGVGVIDDLRPLTPGPKFLLQSSVAVVAVAMGNVYEFSGRLPIDMVVSLLWILIVVNAFNLTDVCDGLLAGLSVIMLVLLDPLTSRTPVPIVVAGATFGFLALNRPPATIFLGDAGSHFLGFVVASLTLSPGQERGLWPWTAQMLLIAFVPLFEVAFVVFARIRNGVPWWQGSRDHVALRLQRAGLSRLQTDAIAWSVAAAFGIAALALEWLPPAAAIATAVVAVCCSLSFGVLLLNCEPLDVRRDRTTPSRRGISAVEADHERAEAGHIIAVTQWTGGRSNGLTPDERRDKESI